MERIARAKRNSVLELYFTSFRNGNDPGPLELPSARKCARFAHDAEASSSGSKVSSNPCITPPRANAAVKLICPGGLLEPAISSLGSDVVEIIDVTSDAPVATPCKAKKKTNEVSRKCQDAWAIAHPWAEMLRGGDGIVDRVKCIVCSHVKGREVTMGAKSDTLEKHAGKRQAKSDLPHINVKKDEFYVNKKCGHLRAAASYSSHSQGHPSVLQQVRQLHFLYVLACCPYCCIYCHHSLLTLFVGFIAAYMFGCGLQ